MRVVRAHHWQCGREVTAEVADAYDLSRGVAMVCHACREVWWFQPAVEPVNATSTRSPAARRQAAAPVPAAPRAPAVPPAPSPRRARPAVPRAAWIGAVAMAAVVGVILWRLAAAGGPHEPSRARSPAAHSSAPRAAPAPAPRRPGPTPQPALRTVAGRGFTLAVPRRWARFARGAATAVAPSRRSPLSVAVYEDRAPRLTLAQMGMRARNTARGLLPGAAVRGPSRMRVGGHAALRVAATGRRGRRELTVTAAGTRRYVAVLAAPRGARPADLRAARGIVLSLRPR